MKLEIRYKHKSLQVSLQNISNQKYLLGSRELYGPKDVVQNLPWIQETTRSLGHAMRVNVELSQPHTSSIFRTENLTLLYWIDSNRIREQGVPKRDFVVRG